MQARQFETGLQPRNAGRKSGAVHGKWPTRARLVSVLFAVVAFAGCVRLPVLDEQAKGPQIDDLVRRVKCDLYEAFAGPLNSPVGYEWLQTWTAQANLNLIVNNQSQLTPGAVLTEPLKVAPTSLFSMGLGAQANDTATRNETITFTVSMEELRNEFGSGYTNCIFSDGVWLQSELGIREWIGESLSPVAHHYLDIGYHKPPRSATASAVAAATKAIQGARNTLSELGPSKRNRVGQDCQWPPGSLDLSGRAAIQLDYEVVACDLFTLFSSPPPAAPSAPAGSPPAAAVPSAPAGSPPAAAAPATPPPVHDLSAPNGDTIRFFAKTIRDIRKTIVDLMFLGEAGQKSRDALRNAANALAVFVDPPIDTLSHQAQFIIVWNASASPGWTLLRFKGPNPSAGALASVTRTKTHTLNLVIGPPGSSDANGALQALQNGTAFTNALNTSSVAIVSR
jgi:hypothetical protein